MSLREKSWKDKIFEAFEKLRAGENVNYKDFTKRINKEKIVLGLLEELCSREQYQNL